MGHNDLNGGEFLLNNLVTLAIILSFLYFTAFETLNDNERRKNIFDKLLLVFFLGGASTLMISNSVNLNILFRVPKNIINRPIL